MLNRVLVYGGSGALGSSIVDFFSSKNWWICSIDLKRNAKADANVILLPSDVPSVEAQWKQICCELNNILENNKLDAILCVAGGWAGGNTLSTDFIKNTETCIQQSVWSSIIAANIASLYLKECGLLQLTGAKTALSGTPEMIGYGLAKAAVHHMVGSLNSKSSGLPKDCCVVAILPSTLDTPANRASMPGADCSTWTPLNYVNLLLFEWASDPNKRPASGSLIQIITTDGKTHLLSNIAPTPG